MAIHPTDKAQRGFTLIELLIASVVISVLMLAVYHAFTAGLTAWKRVDSEIEAVQRGRAFLANLCSELASASSPAVKGQPVFQGSIHRLTFFTHSGLSDRSVKGSADTTRITYEIVPSRVASGDSPAMARQSTAASLVVRRTRQFYSGSQPISAEASTEVLSGVEHVEFHYLAPAGTAQQMAWQQTWERDALPRAVRVKLILQMPPEAPGQRRGRLLSTSVALPALEERKAASQEDPDKEQKE